MYPKKKQERKKILANYAIELEFYMYVDQHGDKNKCQFSAYLFRHFESLVITVLPSPVLPQGKSLGKTFCSSDAHLLSNSSRACLSNIYRYLAGLPMWGFFFSSGIFESIFTWMLCLLGVQAITKYQWNKILDDFNQVDGACGISWKSNVGYPVTSSPREYYIFSGALVRVYFQWKFRKNF